MVKVRSATPDDANAIARIYVDTWRSVYAGTLPDHVLTRMSHVRQSSAWRQEVGGRNGRWVLVAELPKAGIVGFVGLGANRFGPSSYDGEIQTLYVLDDYQDRGVGRALLTTGLHRMKGEGFHKAVVWVLASNPARFFYEAMGGQRIAERDETLWGTVLKEAAYGWPDLMIRDRQRADGPRTA